MRILLLIITNLAVSLLLGVVFFGMFTARGGAGALGMTLGKAALTLAEVSGDLGGRCGVEAGVGELERLVLRGSSVTIQDIRRAGTA